MTKNKAEIRVWHKYSLRTPTGWARAQGDPWLATFPCNHKPKRGAMKSHLEIKNTFMDWRLYLKGKKFTLETTKEELRMTTGNSIYFKC